MSGSEWVRHKGGFVNAPVVATQKVLVQTNIFFCVWGNQKALEIRHEFVTESETVRIRYNYQTLKLHILKGGDGLSKIKNLSKQQCSSCLCLKYAIHGI